METEDRYTDITWVQWKTVKEDRVMKGGEKKTLTLTVKTVESGTIDEQLWKYCKHSYNITNQHKHYRLVREKLDETQCFIHVDFAENYVGKMSTEIQSMHFGASKPQITLHTGYYVVGGTEHLVSFSDSLHHNPASICRTSLRRVLLIVWIYTRHVCVLSTVVLVVQSACRTL